MPGEETVITAEDRAAISELISLHGHLTDNGELDRYDELFTPDVVYDVTDFGLGPLTGIPAIRDAALAMGDANPVGHHVTNIVLTAVNTDEVHGRSKGIGINADGTCGSVVYEDTIRRGDRGWRISHRRILARRKPLGDASKT
ncbi:MAG: nuclear transport factor 2 family protein [Catenulispora sp.]|nr:nuclear transport factor 2 family protein [Catenulispora sp.]